MTTPLSVQEQLKQSYFAPTTIIALLFGMSLFDQVWVTDDEGNPKRQAFPNNDQAIQDCQKMQDLLQKFGVSDENTYYMDNATANQAIQVYHDIVKKLIIGRESDPPEDYLIIHNFAGNSTQLNGMQTMLFNEFDEPSGFYKVLPAEDLLRRLASEFSNSYQIGIFTDSRQIQNMTGCVRKPTYEEGQTKDKDSGPTGNAAIEEIMLTAKERRKTKGGRVEDLYNSGNIFSAKSMRKNVLFVFNTRPTLTGGGKSTMIRDLINTLLKRLDHQTLSIQFPEVLSQLNEMGQDSFEMSCSNTIMPLKMFFNHNIITHTYAVIFVNTHTRGLPWDKAIEKAQECVRLFKETFQFSQVEVFTDLPKFRMIEEFDKIQRIANKFENSRSPTDEMCVGVVWIGHTLYLNSHHKDLVQPRDGPPMECSDFTMCPKQHGLSIDGEPISVYEYCSRICRGPHTHLFHILDWWSMHIAQLTSDHIDVKQEFYEMQLSNHSGWWRFNSISVGVMELCQYFANQKEQHDQRVFQFPFHLIEADLEPITWRTVTKPEQMVLDLRTKEQKELLKQNQKIRTLKKGYDIWEERPRMVAAEMVQSFNEFSHMVQRIGNTNQIVHIAMDEFNDDVEFIFHEGYSPFKELQRLSVVKEHFRFCVVVKELGSTPQANSFAAVLFANGCSEVPSKTIIFSRRDEESPWSQPTQHHEPCEEGFSEVARNCFQVETMKHGRMFVLFRDEHMVVLDSNHKRISTTNYQEEIDERLTQCYICREDFNCDGKTFLLTFQVTNNDVSENMCKNWYEGNSLSNTWVMRCKLNQQDLKLEDIDKVSESIMFRTEACQGICEYAPNKMAMYGRPAHLFIVHDWQVMYKIEDPDSKNQNKYAIEPMPGFDLDDFPFLVCSGESSFNLFSVKEDYMEPLVNAATSVMHAQTAFFFENTNGGLTMHFTTTRTNDENRTLQNWHTMHFQQDFVDILRNNGRLPIGRAEDTLEILKRVKELQAQKEQLIAQHAKEIEELKRTFSNQEVKQIMTPRGTLIDEAQLQYISSSGAFPRDAAGEPGKSANRTECCSIF